MRLIFAPKKRKIFKTLAVVQGSDFRTAPEAKEFCHDHATTHEGGAFCFPPFWVLNPMDYIYVDNSNLYIEGRRVSAVQTGLAPDIYAAMSDKIFDHGYTICFGKLHEFLTGDDLAKIKRVAPFGASLSALVSSCT